MRMNDLRLSLNGTKKGTSRIRDEKGKGRDQVRSRPFTIRQALLVQALSALTRDARRDTLRLAVLRWVTPFVAPRMISGWAAFSAAFAASASPDAMASSTLRMKVLMRLRRAVLTAVRRSIWRTRFFADGELAMMIPLSVSRTSAAYTPRFAPCQRKASGETDGFRRMAI